MGKRYAFKQMVIGQLDIYIENKKNIKNINNFFIEYTKIYLHWTIDLKTKTKTVKLLDENINSFGIGMVFIDKTATAK